MSTFPLATNTECLISKWITKLVTSQSSHKLHNTFSQFRLADRFKGIIWNNILKTERNHGSPLQLSHSCSALVVLAISALCWCEKNQLRRCRKSHRRSAPQCCAARSENPAASQDTQTRPPPRLPLLQLRLHHFSQYSSLAINSVSKIWTYWKKRSSFKSLYLSRKDINFQQFKKSTYWSYFL